MLVYPLAFDYANAGSGAGGSAVNSVLSQGMSMMGGLTSIGSAIASIFILFVIFACIASILDGGKFNVKMLGPIVIYLLVCNFGIVAQPVSTFVSALQSGTAGMIHGAHEALYTDENGNSVSKMSKLIDAYNKNNAAVIAELEKKLEEDKKNDKPSSMEITEEGGGETDKPHKKFLGIDFTAIGDRIQRSIQNFWDDMKVHFARAFVSYEIEGSVITGVAIAFGPISWAFGVLPGNGHVIKSWFIRICQFALYSPLCQLINYFSSLIFLNMVGSDSTLGLVAVLLCNLVMLTAIPQIASSIIEGASGGLALSTGVQTLMSPMRMLSEWNMMGERGRDEKQQSIGQQQLNTLKEISGKLGRAASGGAGGAAAAGGGAAGGAAAAGQTPIV